MPMPWPPWESPRWSCGSASQLGRRTIDALLDGAPAGMERLVATVVEAIPGVHNCHNIRIRYSGPVLFIDLHVLVDGGQTLAQAHVLTETIERCHSGGRPASRRNGSPRTEHERRCAGRGSGRSLAPATISRTYRTASCRTCGLRGRCHKPASRRPGRPSSEPRSGRRPLVTAATDSSTLARRWY